MKLVMYVLIQWCCLMIQHIVTMATVLFGLFCHVSIFITVQCYINGQICCLTTSGFCLSQFFFIFSLFRLNLDRFLMVEISFKQCKSLLNLPFARCDRMKGRQFIGQGYKQHSRIIQTCIDKLNRRTMIPTDLFSFVHSKIWSFILGNCTIK